jgi:methylated-DNA-[protein]-cysteine S-methyltransferase
MEAANFRYSSPFGRIAGYVGEKGLRDLRLEPPEGFGQGIHFLHSAPNITLGRVLTLALDHYFAGAPESFDDIPLDLSSGTAFQQSVWKAARRLHWGQTSAYGGLAKKINRPVSAARAVGSALGANPVHLIVPCHRVLPAQGGLGGFAAGTIWKRHLLELEQSWPGKKETRHG